MEAPQRRQTSACSTSASRSQLGPQQPHLPLLPQWWPRPTFLLATPPSLCPHTSPFQALFLQKALVQQSSCCCSTACSQTRTQRLSCHRYARANCPSEMDGNWHPPLVASPPVLLVRDLHATRRGLEASPPTLLHLDLVLLKESPGSFASCSFGTVVLPEEDQQSPLLLFYPFPLIGTPTSAPWHR